MSEARDPAVVTSSHSTFFGAEADDLGRPRDSNQLATNAGGGARA